MLSPWNALAFLFGLTILVASFFWTRSRWRSRGGLKVQFFQDSLSRNLWLVTGLILLLTLLAALGINVALLYYEPGSFAPLASNLVFLSFASVLVSQADVEGCYGAGIFARKGPQLVRVDWGDVTPDRGKVHIVLDGSTTDRYFLATKRNVAWIAKKGTAP